MLVRVQSVLTPTHGRVLIRERAGAELALVGFHGYAQSAEDMMEVLRRFPISEQCTLVAIQALHRFYTRGDQKIVASWMTRQDREQAITDNVAYVNHALANDAVSYFTGAAPGLVYVGFSQGVAMAYRAALLGNHRAEAVIAIGGDVPPDVKEVPRDRWPRVMIAAGANDQWYTAEKVAADEAFLKHHHVAHEVHRSAAGHEATDEMLAAAAAFIAPS
jgi:predicted esterase